MEFDQEEVERLAPATRVEVQGYYALKFEVSRRKHEPERRGPPPKWKVERPQWPRAQTWGDPIEASIRKLGKRRARAFSPRVKR